MTALRNRTAAPALDACLYGAALTFALSLAVSSDFVTFRTWARFATPGYGVALLATIGLAGARASGRVSEAGQQRARRGILALCAVCVCVAPLVFMAHARLTSGPDYAQSEVVIVESAAGAAVEGHDPYDIRFTSPELDGRMPGIRQHFPYLPGMLAFGLPRVLDPSSLWSDARVWFALFTLVAVATALRRTTVTEDGALRAWQVLVVMPPGALALASGGDDLPVIAMCLASAAALDRDRVGRSAVWVAAAAMVKLTAWPFLFAIAVALWVRGHARRALMVTVAPVLLTLWLLVRAPGAGNDLLAYPLHRTALESPADDPTLGAAVQDWTSASPSAAAAVSICLPLLLAMSVLILAARRGWLSSSRLSSKACAFAGALYCFVLALAPAWRPGYIAYPVNAILWALLLRQPPGVGVSGPRLRHNAGDGEEPAYQGG